MGLVIDKILGIPLLHDHNVKQVTDDPASGKEGQFIINTTAKQLKVWFDGAWRALHTLGDFFLNLEDDDQILTETDDKFILEI